MKSLNAVRTSGIGALAGLAGGLAEIGWVILYGAVTGAPTEPVARGVVGSLLPAFAASSWSPSLGIVIHLVLAVLLGLGLAFAFRFISSRFGAAPSEFGFAIIVLAAVWAGNFFLVLPLLNPAYVHLLPLGVTLVSKLLFGVTAAAVLRADRAQRERKAAA